MLNISQFTASSFVLFLKTKLPMVFFSLGFNTPKGTNGPKYVLVTIDYFIKLVEAAFYAKITSKHAANFVFNNLIFKYRVSYEWISHQGSYFRTQVLTLLKKISDSTSQVIALLPLGERRS